MYTRQLDWNTNTDNPDGKRGWSLLRVSQLTEWETRQSRRTATVEVHQNQCLDHEIDVPVAIKRETSLSLRVTGSLESRLEADTTELMNTLARDGCASLRIREDTSVMQKRFGVPDNSVH